MKVKIGLGVGLLAMAAIGLWLIGPWRGNGVLELPGIVEIQEVRLGSKVGGRVEALLVEEGASVYADQPLVVLEMPELKAQRQQQKARVDAARAEWERAKNGPRPEEIEAALEAAKAALARYQRMKEGWREEEKRQAASDLKFANAEKKQAEDEFLRVSNLYQQRSIALAEFDVALGNRDRARGRQASAQAKVDLMESGNRMEDKNEAEAEWKRQEAKYKELKNGSRQEDKDLSKARLDEAEAKLEEIDVNLREAVVRVPKNLGKAIVEVLAVRPGDIVQAGQPVVRVLRAEDLWVKVFVPETQLGHVLKDQEVEVTIDSHPGVRFKGVVKHRAQISEFTPRNVQSADERRHQVFGVKVRVDDPQGRFNSGMAASVRIPLEK